MGFNSAFKGLNQQTVVSTTIRTDGFLVKQRQKAERPSQLLALSISTYDCVSEAAFDRTRELLKERHMPLVHRSTGALCTCGTVVCDLYSLLNVR